MSEESVSDGIDDVEGAPETDAPQGVRWSVVVVAAVLALGLGILGWNVWHSRQPAADAAGSDIVATASAANIVSHDELAAAVAPLAHTIYWAGDQGLTSYELTRTGRDVYIRYLPDGVPAGSADPYLTVATYEQDKPYAGLESAAKVPGAVAQKLGGGALVVQPADKPTSAYFAFPNTHLLMEVYDPTPGRAFELIRSAVIAPFS